MIFELTHRTNLTPRGDYTVIRAAECLGDQQPKSMGPGSGWIPADKQAIEGLTALYTENQVRYYGHL